MTRSSDRVREGNPTSPTHGGTLLTTVRGAARPCSEVDGLGGPEVMAMIEQQATDLEKENGKLLVELVETSWRLEASDKELNNARGELSIARRQLKEQRAEGRKADEDLLKAMRELEAQWTELLRKAIEDYKETTGFKLGLQLISRVSYEYEYQTALGQLGARYSGSEVEEDPFTI
ncbi:hypothetical protein BHE74_00050662 [Ensete ventricosum]|nr:hypothetical protein BHE74_00050662 [Ensete ventricosum]